MRRNSRDLAFKLIYESYFSPNGEIDFSIKQDDQLASYTKPEFDFAVELYQTFINNRQAIEAKIQSALKDYTFERVYKIDLAFLCLAIVEIDHHQTPIAIATNEMLELAKIYSTEKSPKFLNGVINTIYGDKHDK
jgi:N utilization substance protein B